MANDFWITQYKIVATKVNRSIPLRKNELDAIKHRNESVVLVLLHVAAQDMLFWNAVPLERERGYRLNIFAPLFDHFEKKLEHFAVHFPQSLRRWTRVMRGVGLDTEHAVDPVADPADVQNILRNIKRRINGRINRENLAYLKTNLGVETDFHVVRLIECMARGSIETETANRADQALTLFIGSQFDARSENQR